VVTLKPPLEHHHRRLLILPRSNTENSEHSSSTNDSWRSGGSLPQYLYPSMRSNNSSA
jgi:hypothetical protein